MYNHFNPNPCGKNVGDCTVRAISKATGMEWGEVYLRLCIQGYLDGMIWDSWDSSNENILYYWVKEDD